MSDLIIMTRLREESREAERYRQWVNAIIAEIVPLFKNRLVGPYDPDFTGPLRSGVVFHKVYP